MAGRGRIVAVLAASGCVAATGAAGSAQAHGQSCADKLPQPYVNVAGSPSSKAMVVDSGGKLYGCAYSNGTVHELPGQRNGRRINRRHVLVDEAYVAYLTARPHRDSELIYVVRVKTNRIKRKSDPQDEISVGTPMLLKDNGSVAWTYSWHPKESNGWTKVMKMDLTSDHPVVVDDDEVRHDDPIVLDSLELTQGGTHLSWARKYSGRVPSDREALFE